MRILLLHYADKNSKRIEPLGICYIASSLRDLKYEVDIFDSRVDELDLNEYIAKVVEIMDNYSMIGVSSTQLKNNNLFSLTRSIKNGGFEGLLFIGGFGPTLEWNSMSPSLADCVLIGEGEVIVKKLAKRIEQRKSWKDLNGIAYIESGIMKRNSVEDLPNLDELPFPSRDVLYNFSSKYGKNLCKPLIQGSRGCYMRCSFCSTPRFFDTQGGLPYRMRSIDNIVKEMKILYKKGYKDFEFIDDNFFPLDTSSALTRALNLKEKLLAESMSVTFFMEFRLEVISKELLEVLKSAGLTRLFIGIESFNDKDLSLFQKKHNPTRIHEALKIIIESGFSTQLNSRHRLRFGYINFTPLSTVESLIESANYFKKYGFSAKKLCKKLVVYEENSTLHELIYKEYKEFSSERYFKEFKIQIFYDKFIEYYNVYSKIRNSCRNMEKIMLGNSKNNSILKYLPIVEKYRIQLDNKLFYVYIQGLNQLYLEDYRNMIVSFFDRMIIELGLDSELIYNDIKKITTLFDVNIIDEEIMY